MLKHSHMREQVEALQVEPSNAVQDRMPLFSRSAGSALTWPMTPPFLSFVPGPLILYFVEAICDIAHPILRKAPRDVERTAIWWPSSGVLAPSIGSGRSGQTFIYEAARHLQKVGCRLGGFAVRRWMRRGVRPGMRFGRRPGRGWRRRPGCRRRADGRRRRLRHRRGCTCRCRSRGRWRICNRAHAHQLRNRPSELNECIRPKHLRRGRGGMGPHEFSFSML